MQPYHNYGNLIPSNNQVVLNWPLYSLAEIVDILLQIQDQQKVLGIISDAPNNGVQFCQNLELSAETEGDLIAEMNEMVDKGVIVQVKDRFRMPYSTNKNTISSCGVTNDTFID